MTPEVVSALGNIREHKGKTSLLSIAHPDHFVALVEVAKIQSTSASNRIENISTSDKRLRELMLEKAEPRNRDERESPATATFWTSSTRAMTTSRSPLA